MPVVQLAESAVTDLRELTATRTLPPNALARVRLRLRQLGRFPHSGQAISTGAFSGARVAIGPWWFVFVYVYDEDADVVTVTAAIDGRTATGSTARGD